MHYSQGNAAPANAEAGGPWDKALIASSPLTVCLSCHDDNSRGIDAPDVVGTDSQGLSERAGGFFAPPESLNQNGHNISVMAPGIDDSSGMCTQCHFGGTVSTAVVTCVHCHDPHGNDNYRNLRWANDPGNETDIVAFVNPVASGLDVYERANVRYAAPAAQSSTWREVTNICLDCHHVFSGQSYTDPEGDDIHNRHPVLDSERGAFPTVSSGGTATNPAHWVGGTGPGFSIPRVPFVVKGATSYAQASEVSEENAPFCLSCHKAHGSENAYGLRWPYSNETGAGCRQCHDR